MPYKTAGELPEAVMGLPDHAKRIWMSACNSALNRYPKDEQRAFQIAWGAVKNAGYHKGKDGKWVKSEKASWDSKMEYLQATLAEHHPFGQGKVILHPIGRELKVAIASSLEQQVQGMIGRSFEHFEAMLFIGSGNATTFHNKGVEEDLVLAFFDVKGKFISQTILKADNSEKVSPPENFAYALELPASKGGVEAGSSLTVEGV